MRLPIQRGRLERSRNTERGSAVVIVFALIVIVGSLAVSNNIVLAHLQREVRLVEHRQLQHSGAIARTNQPVAFRALRSASNSSESNSKLP